MQKCIRCGGELEKGFVLDRDGSQVTRQTRWASGEPGASVGTSLWNRYAVQSISATFPVTTYRCSNCGRLEAFAEALV